MTQPSTTYKEVPGFPGYLVGSDGSVWSCHRKKYGGFCPKWRRLKECYPKCSPYPRISLSVDGECVNFPVHAVVLSAFAGPCPDGLEACHGDGNPRNNRTANLRWDTRASNVADRRRHGTQVRGSRVFGAKLSESDIPLIRQMGAVGVTPGAIGERFGVSPDAIRLILKGKTWAHVTG